MGGSRFNSQWDNIYLSEKKKVYMDLFYLLNATFHNE